MIKRKINVKKIKIAGIIQMYLASFMSIILQKNKYPCMKLLSEIILTSFTYNYY